jgi:hypothetical protein
MLPETYNGSGLSLELDGMAGINDNARKEQLLFMEPIMFLKITANNNRLGRVLLSRYSL